MDISCGCIWTPPIRYYTQIGVQSNCTPNQWELTQSQWPEDRLQAETEERGQVKIIRQDGLQGEYRQPQGCIFAEDQGEALEQQREENTKKSNASSHEQTLSTITSRSIRLHWKDSLWPWRLRIAN